MQYVFVHFDIFGMINCLAPRHAVLTFKTHITPTPTPPPFFFFSLGHVAKVYRPNNAEKIPMEFALVGFFEESAVQQALDHPDLSSLLGSDGVTAGTVKPWLLELYPEKPFQY